MIRAGLRGALALCILALPSGLGARQRGPDSTRSTRSGVYTADQASRGNEVYAMGCASCHTAATHTGPAFSARWNGQPLAALYEFIRGAMPKSDPGSLTEREYLLALVYMLQVNGMPPGAEPLRSDSLALNRITIDFTARRDSTPKR